MNLSHALKDADSRQCCGQFMFAARALVHVCRLALDNDTTGGDLTDRMSKVETALSVAEALMVVADEGIEDFERELEVGVWARKSG